MEAYCISISFKRGCYHADIDERDGFHDGKGLRYVEALGSGEFEPEKKMGFVLQSGTKACDYVGTTWVSLELISSRLRQILVDHQITGWRSHPVTLCDKKDRQIPGYHLFQVTGRCGPILWEKSKKVLDQPKADSGIPLKGTQATWKRKGLFWDDRQWDGSDIFKATNAGFRFVNKRTADLFRTEGVSNMKLVPVNEVVLV